MPGLINPIRCTGVEHGSDTRSGSYLPELVSQVVRVARFWRKRRQQLAARRLIEPYLALDDHALKDIGLRRPEVTCALQLPLAVDASRQLEAIRLHRFKRFRQRLG